MYNQGVINIFEDCLKNPEILQKGEEYFQYFLIQQESFALESLQLVIDKSLDRTFRKHCGYLIKNVLIHNWESISTQNEILQLFYTTLSKNSDEVEILLIIGQIFAKVALRNETSEIHQLIGLFINTIYNNEKFNRLSLDFIILLYSSKDCRLAQYANQLLQVLLASLRSQLNESDTNQVLKLVYLVIDTFSYADITDISLVKSCFDSTVVQWMQFIMSVLQGSVSQQQQYIETKTILLKIVYSIVKDLKNYIKEYLDQIRIIIQQYFYKISKLYFLVRIQGYTLESIDPNIQLVQDAIQAIKMESYVLDFYDDIMDLPTQPQSLIDYQIYYVLYILLEFKPQQICEQDMFTSLFYALCLNPYHLHEFHRSPQILIQKDSDESNLRIPATLILEQMICNKKIKHLAIQTIFQFLQTHSPIKNWYLTEVKLFIFEEFMSYILKDKDKDQLYQLVDTVDLNTTDNLEASELVQGKRLHVLIQIYNQMDDQGMKNKAQDLLAKLISYLSVVRSNGAKFFGIRNISSFLINNKNLLNLNDKDTILNSFRLKDGLVHLHNIVDEENLDILLDSELQLLKIFDSQLDIYPLVVELIVKQQKIYETDPLISQIMNEIIEIVASNTEGWNLLILLLGQTQGVLWFYVMRQLVQKAQNLEQQQFVGQKVGDLIKWMYQPQSFESDLMPQATILLKGFIDKMAEKLIQAGFKEQILGLNLKLLSCYDDPDKEQATIKCGPLIFATLEKLNDKKFLPDVIDLIIRKILFHETPSVIEYLSTVVFLNLITYPNEFQIYLNNYEDQYLERFLNKILSYQTVFTQHSHLKIIITGFKTLLNINADKIKNLKYIDKYTQKQSDLITTIQNYIEKFSEQIQVQRKKKYFYKKQNIILENQESNSDDDSNSWEEDELAQEESEISKDLETYYPNISQIISK